jgi:hypothetical protein
MRIEIPVTESSFRYKLQNRFTSQRNAYSHANGIPIPIRPESLFRSNGMSILIDRNTQQMVHGFHDSRLTATTRIAGRPSPSSPDPLATRHRR